MPDEKNQIHIETELGIPRSFWAQPPPDAPDAPAPAEPATLAEARAAQRDDVASAQRLVKAGLLEVQGEPDLARRSAIMGKLTATMQALGKMTGVTAELTPEQIMRSPAWDPIEVTTIAALEPWPDALEAAVTAWERLSG